MRKMIIMAKCLISLFIVSSLFLLSGCGSTPTPPLSAALTPPKIHWIVKHEIDEFSDIKTCMVTVGSLYTQTNIYDFSSRLYPFIAKKDGELLVGVRSGGKIKIPVGNIQLRIDNNKAWTITTSETPLDFCSKQIISSYSNAPADIAKLYGATNDQIVTGTQALEKAMEYSSTFLSPYTATTGEKAKKILNEMLNGKILKYRSISFNIQGTTGKYELDESFKNALKQCGIIH